MRVFQDIADGKEIALQTLDRETCIMFMVMMLHRYFTKQLLIETKHLEAFDAEAATHITLYGFAKHMYEYFGHEPKIKFLPWPEWLQV